MKTRGTTAEASYATRESESQRFSVVAGVIMVYSCSISRKRDFSE